MGSKGIALASAAGGFVGLFVGIGLGRVFAGTPGQRSSSQASLMLAFSAVGASAGAYTGGYVAANHVLSLPATT